jgi:GNAT superfamily N-acetyltransferase
VLGQRSDMVAYRVARDETGEVRRFLAREWPPADRSIFGRDCDWTSYPVVVEARAGRDLVGVALGEVIAGMARLHDLLVDERHRDSGIGGQLVELFCTRAAALAATCAARRPSGTAASTSGSASSRSPASLATTTITTSSSTCASPSRPLPEGVAVRAGAGCRWGSVWRRRCRSAAARRRRGAAP